MVATSGVEGAVRAVLETGEVIMQHKTKKIRIGKDRRRQVRLKQEKQRRHAINQDNRQRKRADKLKQKLNKDQSAVEQRLMQNPAVKTAIAERLAKGI